MSSYDLSDKFSGYGRHEIVAQSTADGFLPSDEVIEYYDIGPTIAIASGIVRVINIINGVTSFGVYIDDVIIDTVAYDYSASWTLDLSQYSESLENGRHTVKLCANGDGIADNRSNAVVHYVGASPVYGVSGLYSSEPTLTRTDDAVGMNFAINDATGEIASDFNDVFPWNETSIVEDAAGKFVAFPEMYFRVGADENHRLTDIAVSQQPNGEGTWHRVAPFMYGCYGGSISDGTLKSVSGVERQGSTTRAQFRSYAAANGGGYHQLDLYHRTVLMFLWYIEFATKKSDSIMTGRISGSGTNGGNSKRPTGGTDSLGTPSGYETAYGQMRYHYIEDFIGNQMEFVDGVCCKGVGAYDYVTDNPDDFSDDTTNKTPLAYPVPSNNWLTALGWDSDNPFMCMPADTNGGSGTTYFCDYSGNADSSSPVLYCGVYYSNASAYYGLSYFYRCNAGGSNANRGGRLLKT